MRSRARWCTAAAGLVVAIAAAGCGVPEDSEPRAIESIFPTTTTTSTPETTASAGTIQASIYLLDSNGRVFQVPRELASDQIRVSLLISELQEATTAQETAQQLTSAVPAGISFFADPVVDGDLARLDLNPSGLELIANDELIAALAQIVWTLTGTEEITRVEILIGGDSQEWPTPGGSDQRILEREQFRSFDPDFVPDQPAPTPEAITSEDPDPAEEPTATDEGDGG